MEWRISTIVESELGRKNSSTYQKFPFFSRKLLKHIKHIKVKRRNCSKLDIIRCVGKKLRMIVSTYDKNLTE